MKTWQHWTASRAEYLIALLKERVRKPSVKPALEGLEQRFLLSASPANPTTTSAPLVGSTTSQVEAIETVLATVRQEQTQMLTTLVRDVQLRRGQGI